MTEEARKKVLGALIKDPTCRGIRDVALLDELYEKIWGFSAADLFKATKIVKRMINDRNCVKFFSFTGNLVSTGFRGLIKDMIDLGFADVILTTCGSIDHDIARTCGEGYFQGTFDVDDKYLEELNIHRLGNIFIPMENYGPVVECVVHRALSKLDAARTYGVREIIYAVAEEIGNNDSFIYMAYKKNIPVFVPGFLDGAFGTAMLSYSGLHKLTLDPFKDQNELAEIVFKAKKSGALIIGGGISKHHTIWWNQFKNGLDYAVYITTAQEYDGSLSGARPREAISWGKIKPEAEYCLVNGDASIIFPLMLMALLNSSDRK
ncbi:MAG: deoxyhypusine synthase [Nitrososphaeria archaeon]